MFRNLGISLEVMVNVPIQLRNHTFRNHLGISQRLSSQCLEQVQLVEAFPFWEHVRTCFGLVNQSFQREHGFLKFLLRLQFAQQTLRFQFDRDQDVQSALLLQSVSLLSQRLQRALILLKDCYWKIGCFNFAVLPCFHCQAVAC